jgi:orotidine-5'-phosphate decarboxylase
VATAGGGVVTVHATGGIKMMKGAVASGVPKVLAVMLLTSLTNDEVRRYYNRTPEEIIPILVEDALEAGVTGFITPPTQVKLLAELRTKHGKPFKIVTPGTRSAGVEAHDQVQVDTPLGAMQNGADYLVLGRQITAAKNPSLAFQKLITEVAPALVVRV